MTDTQEANVPPPSLTTFIAWLEKQSPYAEYNWSACDGTCLIDRYLKAEGHDLTDDNYFAAQGGEPMGIALTRPWTIGAALDRARAVVAKAEAQS